MGTFKKVVRLNQRKSVAVTSFKKGVWLHLRDERKNKSVSFSKEDFVNLLESLGKIRKYIKNCEKTLNKEKKKKDVDSDVDSGSSFDEAEDSDDQ